MILNKKRFAILIILSLIIVNTFFYFKSRLYVSTYVFDSISIEDLKSVFKNQALDVKNTFNKYGFEGDPFDDGEFNILNKNLFSGIVRFSENNKSYKYLYSKKKKLDKKNENKLFSIVNRIGLEGAYFLNPQFLSTVQMRLYYNDKKDKEMFSDYIKFIIREELKKENQKLFSLSPAGAAKLQINSANLKHLRNFTEFVLFGMKNNVNRGVKLVEGREDAKSLVNIYELDKDELKLFYDIKAIQSSLDAYWKTYENSELYIKKLRFNLNEVFDLINQKHKNDLNYYFYYNFDRLYNITKYDDFYNNLGLVWEYTLIGKKYPDPVKFNDKNFDLDKLTDIYSEKIKLVNEKFNIKELISINIFAIIFTLIVNFIFENFQRKKSF